MNAQFNYWVVVRGVHLSRILQQFSFLDSKLSKNPVRKILNPWCKNELILLLRKKMNPTFFFLMHMHAEEFIRNKTKKVHNWQQT